MALEKHIKLSEEANEILLKIQKEKGFTSLNRTLEFMIIDYDNNRNIAKEVSNSVAESLNKVLTRIRLGTRTADINSQIIVEMLNAMSYQFDVAPMTTDFEESKVYTVSKQQVKERISNLKQKKDDKTRR